MAADLRERFETLADDIRRAADTARAGGTVRLGDLERRASELCNEATHTDSETAHSLRPIMAEAISQLDELANLLRERD